MDKSKYIKICKSYKKIEEENKLLKLELNDIKTNLKIDKEIIEGLLSNVNFEDKSQILINKQKEELNIFTKI
jgi:frataxin-like iron-binding protein CyaY